MTHFHLKSNYECPRCQGDVEAAGAPDGITHPEWANSQNA